MVQFTEETSAQGGGMEMIPAGTLVWAVATCREIKLSKLKEDGSGGGQMADMEFIICEGPFTNRKVWSYISDPDDGRNTPKGREASQGHLCRMLESTAVCVPGNAATYQQPRLATFPGCIDTLVKATAAGRKIGIKLGVQAAKDGWPEKQNIASFLSPNPKSGTAKDWEKLKSGQTSPATVPARAGSSFGAAPSSTVAAGAGFGAPARANALAAPAWAGTPEPAAAPATGTALVDDEIPF